MSESLRDRLRKAYDNNVSDRDSRTPPGWKLVQREMVLERLRKEDVVSLLEIGAGVGRDAVYFSEHGLQVTCIDLSPEMVRCCQQKGLHALEMDVANLQFSDASFDAVYSVNCLLHVPNIELPTILQQISRVLRPNGIFYYGTWGGFDHEGVFEDDPLDPPRMFSFRSDQTLRQHVNERFEVLAFDSVNRNPEEPTFLFQSLMLRKKSNEGRSEWN